MVQTSISKYNIIYMLTISFFAIFFTISLPFIYQMTSQSMPSRMVLVGSIFIVICSLGIIAIFAPTECSNIISGKKRVKSNPEVEKQPLYNYVFHLSKFKIKHGHHPQCNMFSDHEFRMGKRTFCAGCTGLLIGTLVSITGSVGYFFSGWSLQNQNLLLIELGITAVTLGLLQFHLIMVRRNYQRVILNAFFILGMFLIIIGIDSMFQSFQIDLFMILIFLFWMTTRIFLSRNNHDKNCIVCGFACAK